MAVKKKEAMEAPIQQPPVAPDAGESQSDMMAVLSNMQDAITNLSGRLDKLEGKEMEAPAPMDASTVPVNGQECSQRRGMEEVHMGGKDEKSDLAPMSDAGKDKGKAADPKNVLQEAISNMKSSFEAISKRFEELTGLPEVPMSKKEEPIGPKSIKGLDATSQPANGASGVEFDSKDNKNESDAKDAEGKVEKPSKDFSKPAISKNSVREDPSQPQPGVKKEKPDKMDVAESLFNDVTDEISQESLTHRQSVVSTEAFSPRQMPKSDSSKTEEYKEQVSKTNQIIREWLAR